MAKIGSFIVFLIISAAVLFGAGFTLEKSVRKGSNIALLSDYVKKTTETPRSSNIAVTDRNPLNGVVLSASSDIVCQPVIREDLLKTNSVVNYLYWQGLDYSLGGREALAEKYQIEDYRGTVDQNLSLLSRLKAENSCPDNSSNGIIKQ